MRKAGLPFGDKSELLCNIINLIPTHKNYAQPYNCDHSVFLAKEKSRYNLLTETNDVIITFFEFANDCKLISKLIEKIKKVKINDVSFNISRLVLSKPLLFPKIKVAVAFYIFSVFCIKKYLCNCENKNIEFSDDILDNIKIISDKLSEIILDNADAIRLINKVDSNETFFYLNPPYLATEHGRFNGYSNEIIRNLFEILPKLKGKFLLLTFGNDIFVDFANNNKFLQDSFKLNVVNSHLNFGKKALITRNYK